MLVSNGAIKVSDGDMAVFKYYVLELESISDRNSPQKNWYGFNNLMNRVFLKTWNGK